MLRVLRRFLCETLVLSTVIGVVIFLTIRKNAKNVKNPLTFVLTSRLFRCILIMHSL